MKKGGLSKISAFHTNDGSVRFSVYAELKCKDDVDKVLSAINVAKGLVEDDRPTPSKEQ